MPSMSFKNATHATYQPLPQDAMDIQSQYSSSKAHNHDHCQNQGECESQSQCGKSHSACHAQRRRRLCHFAAIGAGMLVLLAVASFVYSCGWESMMGLVSDGAETALGRRQTTTNGNEQGVFVRNKLYLIVVLVGLFVCLVLGVMLAAWCCRGAFENPCCCPCYLCACCGGLACLECISCGLCAEGVDQIGFN